MLRKIKYILGQYTPRPIFVLGTGRSGTHWVGYILEAHPDIRITIEKKPMFSWVTTMALDSTTREELFPKLIKAYKKEIFKSIPRLYVDKSHPNIWLADKLSEVFPSALFVGIERDPYATIASMLVHPGVAAWHAKWNDYPVPNAFLGITEDNVDKYEDIPLAAKCAMRWVAHRNRMDTLKNLLGEKLLVLNYETMIQDTENQLAKLQMFLGLTKPLPKPEVKVKSLTKWRSQLTEEQIAQIAEVVGFFPEDNQYPRNVKKAEGTKTA